VRSIRLLLAILVAVAIVGGSRATADPVMLAEYPHDFFWSVASATNDEPMFLIKAPNSLSLLCTVGGSQTHANAQTGTYDFFPDDPLEPGFACFLANITDGVDDTVGQWLYIAGTDEGTGVGITESALFGTESDLVGSELLFMRLIVSSLSIQPMKGGGYEFIGQVRWQFWGTSTATPALDGVESSSWGHVRSLYR
jgi:hypothetical protein